MHLDDMTMSDSNQLAKVNDRLAEVENEILEIDEGEQAEATAVIHGGWFSHQKWLNAEKEELIEEQERLMEVMSGHGTGAYE